MEHQCKENEIMFAQSIDFVKQLTQMLNIVMEVQIDKETNGWGKEKILMVPNSVIAANVPYILLFPGSLH